MKKNKELRKAETDKKNNQFGPRDAKDAKKDAKAEQKNQQTAQNAPKAEQNAPKAEQTPNRQQMEQNGHQRESQPKPREQRQQTEPIRQQKEQPDREQKMKQSRQPNEQSGEYRPERYRPKENKEQTEQQQRTPTEPHFTPDKVSEVLQILHEYKDGKTSVDMKATENQEWWRLRHWNVIHGKTEAGKAKVDVGSAWAVNSILNKHADLMDSFPKANVLAREADDEEEAQILSKILPAIEEHTDAEQVYNTAGYDFLIDGTAITAVL